MSRCRFSVRMLLAIAAVVTVSLVSLPSLLASASTPYILLTPRTVPDWPVRTDGNWGRTTNYETSSVDGRYGLISAGSANPSHPGSDWNSIYFSDNSAATLTLASVDENGNRFPSNLANVNPIISPYGRWMAWIQYDPSSSGSIVFARDDTTGQVYRSPTGASAQSASYVTDDGRIFGALHTSLPVGTLGEFWDPRSGTITPLRVAPAPGPLVLVGLSGDASTAVVNSGGHYLALDIAAGTTTTLPIGNPSSSFVNAVSQTGRFVGFSSLDPSLNPERLTPSQVYLFDRQTGTTTWVSAPGIGGRTDPTMGYFLVSRSISDDGRYVIFGSNQAPIVPPLDPAHAGEHVIYFYGSTFERDIQAVDTRLVVADYAYGVAPNSGVVQFDAPTPAGDFGVYLSGPPVSRVAAVPGAPSNVVAVPGDHSATITWLKPASDGGSVILGYTVTASPGGQTCSTDSADVLTCTIIGLTNGVNYTFTVTARNAAGSSAPAGTPAGQPTTVGTPPSPVTVLPPEPDPVDGTRVTLHWLAAQSDPNLPVIGYTATAQPGGHSCSTTGELFCTVTGLDPTVSYTFTVVAINGVGPSPTTKPDPPTAVTATAGGYGQAIVNWTAPASTGGASITSYTATAQPGGAACAITGSLRCTIIGLTPGATYTFTVVATTGQGSSDPSTPSPPFTIGIDSTPPSVNGHADRDPNPAGWYHAPITITWSATDPPLSSGSPTTPSPTTVSAEGANQLIASGSSCDPVGNCATGSYGPVNLDLTAPSINPAISPAPNAAGWVNQAATVTYTCTDTLSGVASCPTPATVTLEGANQTVAGTAGDNAGNTANVSTIVNLDTTAPTITANVSQAANGNGWNNADVTVSFTCTDPLSGVVSCPARVTLTDDGANQVVTGTTTDRAGNTAAATVTVSIDKTRPLITAVGTAANSNGWNNTDVTVSYTCADALSGIASCPAPTTLTAEAAGQSTTGVASDHAGNTAASTVSDVNIDKTPPTITATVVGTKNSAGWYRTPPTIHYICADSLSGVSSCPADVILTTDGANQTITGTSIDNAGNTATASIHDINVDTTPPLVAVAGAADATTYPLNQLPAPSCTTNDATSGVATAATMTLSRTASGVYTATCAGGTDRAGNTTPLLSITYTATPTTGTLVGLTNQYLSASGSPDTNGVIHDLDNKLDHNQICLYITKVNEQTGRPNPALTATQAAELIYWARTLDPTC